jgi:hypothetical protein
VSIPFVTFLHNLKRRIITKGWGWNMGIERHRQSPDDRFSRMMFGNRRDDLRNHHHEAPNSNQSSINIESLIDSVGKLRESSQNLKPLIQMVYPFVEQFFKKK